MKNFFFNFEDGLDEKYIEWTKEAVQDFINLFPEYKDNFGMQDRNLTYNNLDFLKGLFAQNKKIYEDRKRKQNDTAVFDEKSFWQMFEKLPDGSYRASLQKQIDLATRNGMLDILKLSQLQADSAGNMYSANTPILVNVSKRKAEGNIRGVSSEIAINISAGTCAALGYRGEDLKSYFKDIIIHELGHTFNATHEGRKNAVENLGMHCKDKNCLMYEYAYTDESFNRRKKLKEPFCQDCMVSMRDYMKNTLHFVKTSLRVNNNTVDKEAQENTNSVSVTNNLDFKKAWRKIFQKSAEKQNAEYKENIKSPEYKAEIKHANGSVDKIVAKNASNINLSAKDKDGNTKLPNMQRFRDIVAYAQEQGTQIEFGNIKSPEFKACLMLACMEAKPAMEMIGAPDINDEFLQTIKDAKIKSALQIMKNKLLVQQTVNSLQKAPSVATAPAPQTEYEKSREIRRRTLEAKEKSGKISKMEKAELEYIRAAIQKGTELKKAIIKYNSEDPRFTEHQQKSGLKTKDFYYSSKTRTSCADWKLHLDVVPNRNHPTTKAISEMLEKLDVEHKIAKGGENGKGVTIYVGNYNDTLRLSKEINSRFGKEIETSPCYVDQNLSEHYFNPKVSGRFWMQNTFKTQYPRSSAFGICPATGTKNNEMEAFEAEYRIFDLGQKNGIIPAEDKFSDGSYDLRFFHHGDFHKSYVFHNLEAYCSHKLYQKELGEFYCGKNTDKFEKDFFGDKIPEKGTTERANWDKAAQEYVSFIENMHPNLMQKMRQEAQKYHSVDFSKLPPIPQNTQVRGGGRSA